MKMLCFMTCINAFWGSKKDDINWHNTVPFVPPVTSGNVIKVYDGDTITVASKLPMLKSPLYRFPVRLTGIDSPEIKGKSEAEITLAKQSRDALSELILGKNVQLANVSTEKYGRLLADVYIDGIHVNQWMLDNKYAIPYDGGTKSRPTEWN
jgi:endonuclease YncB( thermonuclease family)